MASGAEMETSFGAIRIMDPKKEDNSDLTRVLLFLRHSGTGRRGVLIYIYTISSMQVPLYLVHISSDHSISNPDSRHGRKEGTGILGEGVEEMRIDAPEKPVYRECW